MYNLENNPFEICLLQKLKVNIGIRNLSIGSEFIENQRFNLYTSALRNDRAYIMSIIPSNSILSSDKTIIMIFDVEGKNLVADTRLKKNSISELSKFVYTIARKYFKDIKILIPRSSFGLGLLDILLKTEIRDNIVSIQKTKTVKDFASLGETSKVIISHGIDDNLQAYHENCSLLKTLIENEPNTVNSNEDLYLYSPFIVDDILSLEVRKVGDYELTQYLKTFLNGMKYMLKSEVTINTRGVEGEGDE